MEFSSLESGSCTFNGSSINGNNDAIGMVGGWFLNTDNIDWNFPNKLFERNKTEWRRHGILKDCNAVLTIIEMQLSSVNEAVTGLLERDTSGPRGRPCQTWLFSLVRNTEATKHGPWVVVSTNKYCCSLFRESIVCEKYATNNFGHQISNT